MIQNPMYSAHIHLDFETFSEDDLTKIGAYKYAEHCSTDVLLASWFAPDLVKHNRPKWWRPGDPYPFAQWHDRLGKDIFIVAWNSQFERIMWWKVMCKRYGWPKPPLEAFICASAWARGTAAAPAKLELAGQFFAQQAQKDMAGHRLMLQMCKPATDSQQLKWLNSEDADIIRAVGATLKEMEENAKRCHHTPQRLDNLHYYCDDDVLTEHDITKILPEWPLAEIEAFWESEYINDEGLPVDTEFACAAAEFAEDEKAELNAELTEITDGVVTTPRQFVRFKEWALPRMSPEAVKLTEYYEKGIKKNSFDANVRHNLLMAVQDDPDLVEPEVWDAIEILDEAGKSTIAKYQAIMNMAITPPDGGTPRVHGLYMYAGAAQSGRYSGVKIQPHNLVRNVPKIAQTLIDEFKHGDHASVQRVVNKWAKEANAKKAKGEKQTLNSPVHALGTLVRPTITIISKDHDREYIVWCDWSSIEAIALPWLTTDHSADELLERFRRGDDIYIPVASSILNKPAEQITKFERQAYGKVTQLSLNFLGSEGALTAMAKNYGVKFEDREKALIVKAWRKANPWAQRFGKALDRAAKGALKRPNVGYSAGRIEYIYEPRDLGGLGALYAILPSGRALCYPDPDIKDIKKSWGISNVITCRKGSWHPAKDAKDWPRVGVWRGLLAENCIAHDTEVLTDRGWVCIQQVRKTDKLWDGLNWVTHAGLVRQGNRKCINTCGIWTTPEHELLTKKGWVPAAEAQRCGYNRQSVRLPYNDQTSREEKTLSCSSTSKLQQFQVYDLKNAGPLKRFTVCGSDGAVIVHNCTQATCADLLNLALLRAPYPPYKLRVIGHTHDEIIIRTKNPEEDAEKLKKLMEARPPWRCADSLPIRAEVEWGERYKVKAA